MQFKKRISNRRTPTVPTGGIVMGLSAIICPLILTLDPCRGPIEDCKKTWVDIPDVGQKGVIQDGVQDPRRALSASLSRFIIELGE